MAYTLIPTELILDNAVTSAKLDTNIAVSGTLASTGVLTANAGVVVDNFTLDGTTLALSSGNFTIDVAGNIVVDTDTGYIQLADAGTVFGSFKQGSSNLEIKAEVQDKDVLIKGNDGGTEITALTFDMSAAGVATFNSTIVSPLIDAAVVDGENFKINGGQGTDGQLMTSTGSGVAWEDAPAGGPLFKTFGDSSFLVGNATTGTINGADYNTGVGVLALNGITTGDSNTAIGRATLYVLTTGSSNTAVGMNAAANVTGSNNTAVGESALSSATGSSASHNTAVGKEALKVNTTGTANVSFGSLSLDANTSGSYNTSIGYGTLTANTTGHDNTAVGINSLAANTTAHYNTAVGSSALEGCTTGEYNTALGQLSMGGATHTGNFNTAVGRSALRLCTSGSSNVAIGLSAGDVHTTGNNNVFIGESTGKYNTTGAENTYVGWYAGNHGGVNMTTGSHNTYIGMGCSGSAVSNIAEIVLGRAVNGAGSKTFTVGVSYSATHRRTLDLTSSATSFTNPSDLRLKENITDSSVGLNFINDLRPITYTWKARKDVPTDMSQYKENSTVPCAGTGKTNYGFIAQEVKATIDNHSVANGQAIHSQDPDGTQHLSPAELVPMLVKALQEADNKIDALTARIETLEG